MLNRAWHGGTHVANSSPCRGGCVHLKWPARWRIVCRGKPGGWVVPLCHQQRRTPISRCRTVGMGLRNAAGTQRAARLGRRRALVSLPISVARDEPTGCRHCPVLPAVACGPHSCGTQPSVRQASASEVPGQGLVTRGAKIRHNTNKISQLGRAAQGGTEPRTARERVEREHAATVAAACPRAEDGATLARSREESFIRARPLCAGAQLSVHGWPASPWH